MKFVGLIFPFFVTLFLWRLSLPFWNPAGILAIIPIFYYSFISPRKWFALFAFFMCFLLDYIGGTLLFWTLAWCLLYAVNGFQNYIDLTRQKADGLFIFMCFFGLCLLILSLMEFSFYGLVRNIWLFFWSAVLYIPLTKVYKCI